jgi:hypothetical protein
VQDGPAWDFCKRYELTKNGREAIMVVKCQQESLTGITSRKNKAYTALDSLQFTGPRRDWSFEQYINGHLSAHITLEQCGEPVTPAKKVKDFLDNIHDDQPSNAKDLIYGDDNLMVDFEILSVLLLVLRPIRTRPHAKSRNSWME